MPRIAFCGVCQKVEKLLDPPPTIPLVEAHWEWYEGRDLRREPIKNDKGEIAMVPEHDPQLEDWAYRHQHGANDRDAVASKHIWQTDQTTFERMDAAQFVKEKMDLHNEVMLEESNHIKDEALRCYNSHGNPDMSKKCIDFCDDSKALGAGNRLPPEQRVYVCHFCPYTQAAIATEVRWKNGMYGNQGLKGLGPQAKSAIARNARRGRAARRKAR